MKETEDCFLKVKNQYLNLVKKEKISNKSKKIILKNLKDIYIPISFWINNKFKKKTKTLFIGLSGGQGAGKTTVSKILKIILKEYFKRKTQIVSIDDFYKTSKERYDMSKKIHYLFKTRGVPGTHDVSLIKKFFYSIKKKNFKSVMSPKFNKSLDDRLKSKNWHKINKKPEIVIFEGWCVGAKSQSNFLIKKPINTLEKFEDINFFWRKYVNNMLKKDYKKIFSNIDYFIFMKVPDFNSVFKWRLLQEVKLEKTSHFKKKIMSYNEIKRFVMFYERITLQMIKDLSKSASVVMILKKNHQIRKVVYRK